MTFLECGGLTPLWIGFAISRWSSCQFTRIQSGVKPPHSKVVRDPLRFQPYELAHVHLGLMFVERLTARIVPLKVILLPAALDRLGIFLREHLMELGPTLFPRVVFRFEARI